jgi:hypothetical protein
MVGINGQITSEFRDIATQGAFALACPPDLDPVAFWLFCLAQNLFGSSAREIAGEIIGDPETGGFVQDLLASSLAFCSRLAADSERSMRSHAQPVGGDEVEPQHCSVATRVARGQKDGLNVTEAADRRKAVVKPRLDDRVWSTCRWATEAGVSKNSAYEYLKGKRRLSKDNRTAMAQVLGLNPEHLPE